MSREKWSDSLDHREPVWKEGRDYQLVCGFEKDTTNHRICTIGENSRKSNRFVPWRVAQGWPVPEEPGDWAWFLNLETEEWEFIPWLGDRWFELTRKVSSGHFGGKTAGKKNGGWNKGITNEPRGAFKPGCRWYNNGKTNKRVFEGEPVPRGFAPGRLFTKVRNNKGQFEKQK
jgi:hypothetical protein